MLSETQTAGASARCIM